MKTPYAIGRIKKLHMRDIENASHHNYRTRPVANANPSGAIIPLIGAIDGNTFNKVINKRFEQWKARKLAAHTGKRGAKMARDPVVCVEVMLSASPEFFRPLNPDRAGYWELERLKAWEQKLKEFARSHFGKNLVSLVLHLDEATPHAHALVMPFDENGNLNAKKVFNRQGLIRLQDTYAEYCKPLGVQRGLRGSTAKHEQVKKFYTLVNIPTPEPNITNLKPKIPRLPNQHDRLNDANLEQYAVSAFRAGVSEAAKSLEGVSASVQAKANAYDLLVRKEETISHSLEAIQKSASEVRVIPLADVFVRLGATELEGRWCMPERRFSLKGSKFYDEIASKSGNGAIDLVMHCEGIAYREAVAWLSLEFGQGQVVGEAVRIAREKVTEPAKTPAPLPLPMPAPEHLPTVIDYLISYRGIPAELINILVETGRLYADRFANCVFTLSNEDDTKGAELVGTGDVPFSSIRGHKGLFALPPIDLANKQAIFVKSAVEALSYRALHPACGWVYAVTGNAIKELIKLGRQLKRKGYALLSAFDNSDRGIVLKDALKEVAASSPIDSPTLGDWNDKLLGKTSEVKVRELGQFERKTKTLKPF